MGGYEYANARLRTMKSRLLSLDDYRDLVAARSLDELLRAMTRTDYRESIEATPILSGELDALNSALSHHLRHRIQKIHSFFDEAEWHPVSVVLQKYDVHNIKALLRGLENNATPEDIRDAQLPIGLLTSSVLQLLAQASSWQEALDLTASMRLAIASPLMAVRAKRPNASTLHYELALDRWYVDMALAESKRNGGKPKLLREFIAIEADLMNLLTILRYEWLAGRDDYLGQAGAESIRDVLVGPGFLSLKRLEACTESHSVEAVVHDLASTRYGNALEVGFAKSQGRLSVIESSLRRYRLKRCIHFMRHDPLGIGVFLGYLVLKINEVGNLRCIAHGVDLRLAPKAMLDELELPA